MLKLTGWWASTALGLMAPWCKIENCHSFLDRTFLGVWVKEGDFNWFIPVGHFVGIHEGELISIDSNSISEPIKSLSNMRGNVATQLRGEAKE